jgi:hypothetical protein
MDRCMETVKTMERNRNASTGGYGASYNTTWWVCLCGSSKLWCALTTWTLQSSSSICWLSLCRGQGASNPLSEICMARTVLWRWGGVVLTLDFRGHRSRAWKDITMATVSNGSGPSHWVWVWVGTEPLTNWWTGSSINPNHQFRYGLMVNSNHLCIGRVSSRSTRGSIYRFIWGSCFAVC